jgi:hypothetical protein
MHRSPAYGMDQFCRGIENRYGTLMGKEKKPMMYHHRTYSNSPNHIHPYGVQSNDIFAGCVMIEHSPTKSCKSCLWKTFCALAKLPKTALG